MTAVDPGFPVEEIDLRTEEMDTQAQVEEQTLSKKVEDLQRVPVLLF